MLWRKSDAVEAIEAFYALVKTQYKEQIKGWMFDGGDKFDSERLDAFIRNKGIELQRSTSYTPQQNGHAERFNRTLMDKAEAMQHNTCIPEPWWEYSIKYAVHLYNRSPLYCLNWCTPYELVNKNKPDITHL